MKNIFIKLVDKGRAPMYVYWTAMQPGIGNAGWSGRDCFALLHPPGGVNGVVDDAKTQNRLEKYVKL